MDVVMEQWEECREGNKAVGMWLFLSIKGHLVSTSIYSVAYVLQNEWCKAQWKESAKFDHAHTIMVLNFVRCVFFLFVAWCAGQCSFCST